MADGAPNDCKQIFEMLSEYLDEELQPGTCEELERHLRDCPPCIDFVESLKRSVQMCRQEAATDIPQPLTAEHRERLRDAFLATLRKP